MDYIIYINNNSGYSVVNKVLNPKGFYMRGLGGCIPTSPFFLFPSEMIPTPSP